MYYNITFDVSFKLELCVNGSLNISHIRQPRPHISQDLQVIISNN